MSKIFVILKLSMKKKKKAQLMQKLANKIVSPSQSERGQEKCEYLCVPHQWTALFLGQYYYSLCN